MTELKNWKQHCGVVVECKNGYQIIDCTHCGFKHIIPIPSDKELKRIYLQEYYTTEKPHYIERNLEDQEWWKTVYDGRLRAFESLLADSSRDILDIGCGPGFFLQRASEQGWRGCGVEPSIKAVEFARNLGLEVRHAFLTESLAGELGTFDVVYMNEVLEHVSSPIQILRIALGMLKPGGLLCLIVPNDYNPIQEALRSVCNFPSWWVAPPHHINYFDTKSIENLADRAGMKILKKEATFPIDLFLIMGDNYIGNDQLGRLCHTKRKTLEINLEKAGLRELRHQLYRSFAEVGIGREIQIIGCKDGS